MTLHPRSTLSYGNVKKQLDERGTKGFSLIEMLVTTLIMGLAATLMATGIPVAIDTYRKTTESANAQLALSTTIAVMRSELGLATDIYVTADKICYYRSDIGCWMSIENSTSMRGLEKTYYIGERTHSVTPDALEKDGVPEPLVSDKAITDGLKVEMQLPDDQLAALPPTLQGKKAVAFALTVSHGDDTLAKVPDSEAGSSSWYRILTRFAD